MTWHVSRGFAHGTLAKLQSRQIFLTRVVCKSASFSRDQLGMAIKNETWFSKRNYFCFIQKKMIEDHSFLCINWVSTRDEKFKIFNRTSWNCSEWTTTKTNPLAHTHTHTHTLKHTHTHSNSHTHTHSNTHTHTHSNTHTQTHTHTPTHHFWPRLKLEFCNCNCKVPL